VIRAKGAFLINAFLMPQVGLDSQIVEPDTSIIAGLPAAYSCFLRLVSKHNLVNYVFNTILIDLRLHIGIISNPGDSTGSGLLSFESPAVIMLKKDIFPILLGPKSIT
jgi:hypothetical protein